MHGHQLGIGGKLARFQGRNRAHQLERAGRRKPLKGPIQQGRLRGIEAGPLAAGGAIGKQIGIKRGPAGDRPNGTGLGIHRHDRPLANAIEGPLRRLLQGQIQGEAEIVAGLGGLVAQDPLHLTRRIHLHLLAAPLAAQDRLIGLLHAAAAHPIADAVPLGLQLAVFVFGDATGVAEHVGPQAPVGIAAQHIHIHLGSFQGFGLLAEPQNLGATEARGQGDAKALGVGAAAVLLIEGGGGDLHHLGQAIAQRRPLAITHQLGLEVEVVGEPAGGQHRAMAIQNPAPNRIAGHQPDPVVIGAGLVLSPLHQLQPGQARHHGAAKHQHHRQQQGRLLAHAAMALGTGAKHHG